MSTVPAIDAIALRRLTASRWLIPILAMMHRQPGSRFSALVRQLGISRSMLSASLDTLERERWIVRNPGHGHPLRPDYLLTPSGRDVAAWSAAADQALIAAGINSSALGRWSLPLLAAFGGGSARFKHFAEALAPISPRALSMALDQLAALRLIEKIRELAHHPRYRMTRAGAELAGELKSAVASG